MTLTVVPVELAEANDFIAALHRHHAPVVGHRFSILYAAAARACKALGFQRIQTYTLPSEGGASLRASGWTCEGEAGGGQWKHTDGKPRRTDQPTDVKSRWALRFPRPDFPQIVMPVVVSDAETQGVLL